MAAERITGVEQRVLLLESMLADQKAKHEGMVADLLGKVNTAQAATTQLGDNLQQVQTDLAGYTHNLADQKAKLMSDLENEFDSHKLALASVVNAAREEFGKLQSHLSGLHTQTAQAFAEVRVKVEEMEKNLDQGGGGRASPEKTSTHGFLPMKAMVPEVFGSSEDKWRAWQEDVADYLDSQKPGLKGTLKAAEKENTPIDDLWINAQSLETKLNLELHKANIYRALKALTTGEARTVIQGVRAENGWEAWRALHQRFGPSVAARQGKVMHELSQMVAKPAKNPAETRSLVTELERRIRVAEEITGDSLGDGHVKSILAAILDPTTRAHTSAYQGTATGYHDLKRVVLEFANNTAIIGGKTDGGGGPEPMILGQCGDAVHSWAQVAAEAASATSNDDEWERVGDLAAVSAHTQCYNCGGYGHLALKCPTPKGVGKGGKGPGGKAGKGDAKGAPKGGPKGAPKGNAKGGQKGQKGPAGGCWTCGGMHYSSECTAWAGKGGGKGKGFNSFNLADQYWPEPSVRPLCCVQKVEAGTATKNRFQVLEEDDAEAEEEKQAPKTNQLSDYVLERPQQKPKQGQRKAEAKRTLVLVGRLSPLSTIEPAGLAPVAETPDWETVELAVDSGASETVIPEGVCRAATLQPSEASKRGVVYEVANGERIPNLGQKSFHGVTAEGHRRGLTAQVCDVNKPLLSVTRLVAAGNTVVFSQGESYVQDDLTGEKMWLRESGGMYMLRLWVPSKGF